MPRKGMLVQIDGSHHPWLEERGRKLVLPLAVHDGTGGVAQAMFRSREDTCGYLAFPEGPIRQWGMPLALNSGLHKVSRCNFRQGPVLAKSIRFAKLIRELGIQRIFDLSLQVKGRVDGWREPFRNGLVTELRLAGTSTIGQATEGGANGNSSCYKLW